MRRSKFGNRKVEVDGLKFDSAKEAKRWKELQLLERAGQIYGLQRQCRYNLIVNGQKVCAYVADFTYNEGPQDALVVEDCKGFLTPEYKLKRKLMKACYDIEIRET